MKCLGRLASATALAVVGLCSPGFGQSTLQHPVGQMLPWHADSGSWDNAGNLVIQVAAFPVSIQNAAWLRLYFEDVVMPEGSYARVTSMGDGEVQTLDFKAMKMWGDTTAYFNGDTVIVEVFAGPGTVGTHLNVKRVAAEIVEAHPVGDPGQCGICGADDRFQTNQLWSGRLMPVGCTASVYCTTGSGMITAGHCLDGQTSLVAQFNVPNSAGNCATQNPPVADQFPVLPGFQFSNAGVGNDWGVLATGVNSVGQTPYQRYAQFRPLATGPAANGSATSMWGYGLDTNCVRSQTQQQSNGNITGVAAAYYDYNNDVRGGNSGSGYLFNNTIIGVVTHCRVGCPNVASRIDIPAFVNARNAVNPSCSNSPPPSNDACANAAYIDVGTVTGSTSSASNDGVSSCRTTSNSPDVWYYFVPSCTGRYHMSTCGSNFDTVLSVHSGCPGNAGNTLVCSDDTLAGAGTACDNTLQSNLDIDLTAGTGYLIRVGGYLSNSGNYTLSIAGVNLPRPANDNCASATVIGVGAIDGETGCATNDGSSNCGFTSTSRDVWYRFTPTCGGTYTATTCGGNTSYDTVVSVHTGCPGVIANTITCDDDSSCGTPSTVSWVATAGTTYLIRVGSYGGGLYGSFTLTLSRGADTFPSNDACANAIAVGAGSFTGSTVCASNDGSADCALSTTSRDVWYSYTSSCGSPVTIDTVGSNYDTALSVHTGCPGTVANQVACDDDGYGYPISRLTFFASANTTYYIRVNGFFNSAGNYVLNVNPFPNNDCANAVNITDGDYPYTNTGATTDGLDAGICTDVAGVQQVLNDVWFRYYSTCNGMVDANTCDALGYDSKMAVYLDQACPASNPIGCNDDMGSACGFNGLRSQVTFPATAGSVYLIRIGGYQGSTGCGMLHVHCTPDNACAQCPADYNQDGGIDGSDVPAFFADWENALPCSDVNQDGGIDGSDVDYFFAVWEAGGCEG